MKKTNYFGRTLMLLGGMLVAITATSQGQTVDLTLQNYSSLDLVQVGGTVGGTQMENAYIGIYTFGVTDIQGVNGLANNQVISSICLGSLGTLTQGTYGYTLDTFAQANPGLNPTSWTYSGTQYWGIQNANYLWGQFGASANSPAAGAALALAIYDALYNSTGYGDAPYTGKGFAPNLVSSAETSDYNADVAALNTASTYISENLANGYVFVPTNGAAGGPEGQSFIILDTAASPNVFTPSPVPEPATIVAASLLLLPLGASTMRILRKERI